MVKKRSRTQTEAPTDPVCAKVAVNWIARPQSAASATTRATARGTPEARRAPLDGVPLKT